LALSLRAILILRAAFARTPRFSLQRADGANLICLNFTGERDFSGVKHRLDLRGFKFKSEKIS